MLKKGLVGVGLALVTILLHSQVAFALLSQPTSVSFALIDGLHTVKVFRNLAETGDMLVLFHYKIEYGSYPTTSAHDSFSFQMIDTDNTTVLKQASPYNFSYFATNGYGDGVSSFYFTAAEAPTWGDAYLINIQPNPAYYSPATPTSYTLTPSDYSDASTQAASQAELYTAVISLCDRLHDVYPTVTLKGVTDSGQVLSDKGESYLRITIPGLQTLCPLLFLTQIAIPTTMPVIPYSMNSTMTQNLLSGSDLETGATRIGQAMGGVTAGTVWGIFFFIISLVICVLTYRANWGVEPGIAICGLIGIGAAIIIGDWFFTIVMIAGLAGGIAISWVLLFRRA